MMPNALRVFSLKAQMYQAAAGQSSPESVTWSLFNRKLHSIEFKNK